jgi:hypothetical protein
MLTEKQIRRFTQLYKMEYGQDLAIEEATKMAQSVYSLIKNIHAMGEAIRRGKAATRRQKIKSAT